MVDILTIGLRGIEGDVHREMVDKYTKSHKKISYSEFKELFNSVPWCGSERYESLFHFESDSEFHASIIQINGIGYKLTNYGFRNALKDMKKKVSEIGVYQPKSKLIK